MEKLPTTFDEAIEVARNNEKVFNDLVIWVVDYENETDFRKLTFWKKIKRYFSSILWAIIAPDLIPPTNMKLKVYHKLIELSEKVKYV